MSVKEAFGKGVMDKRTLIAIIVIAVLWRAGISLNDPVPTIALWESMVSGISLFIMGWALFAYIFFMSRALKGWLELNKIYLWIAVSLIAINIYVIVYYAMRWYRLAGLGGVEEALVHLDFMFRNIRFIVLVIFYCVVTWLAKYLKKVHRDYMLLFKGESSK
jgi:hypothetical protein